MKARFLHLTLVFSLVLAVASIFARVGVDPQHDGVMFKPALDVAEGKVLFKDTFTQYGALSTWIQALALVVFGKTLITIRLLTAFFYAMISILLWLIWSRWLPAWLTSLTCLIWLLLAPYYILSFLPWSSVYSLFFQLLAAYFLIRFAETAKQKHLFACGLATTLTYLCRQPVGILLFFAVLGSLLGLLLMKRENIRSLARNIGSFVIGVIIPTLIFFCVLSVSHSTKDWWLQSMVLPFNWAHAYGTGKQHLTLVRISDYLFPCVNDSVIWVLLPLVCLMTLFLYLARRLKNRTFSSSEISLGLLVPVALASWAQYYPVTCVRHVYWAATPMLGILSYWIWECMRSDTPSQQISHDASAFTRMGLCAGIILMLFHYDIKMRMDSAAFRFVPNLQTIEVPAVLAGMKVSVLEKDRYRKIDKILSDYFLRNPESSMITTGPDPLYLTFSSHTVNFQPMYVPWGLGQDIYPDMMSNLNLYIKDFSPLIIGGESKRKGYYNLNEGSNLPILAPSRL